MGISWASYLSSSLFSSSSVVRSFPFSFFFGASSFMASVLSAVLGFLN
jgi:hypothetical protein